MEEREIESYFQQQVRAILERRTKQSAGLQAYFANREPKDEEILGLLAVCMAIDGEFDLGGNFPTPVEALAALSHSTRSELCQKFRQELKTYLHQVPRA